MPAGLLAPTVHPVIDPMVYSCLPPWDCGMLMLVIVSVAGMVTKMFCAALVVPTGVGGKALLFTTWLSTADVAVL